MQTPASEIAPGGGRRVSGPALRRWKNLTAGVAPLVVVLLLDLPLCPSAALAGRPCPGCGMTRAAWALLRGDLAGAVALNPIAPVALPLLGGAVLYGLVGYLRTGEVQWPAWIKGAVLLVGIAMLAVWALRFLGHFGGPVPV